MFTRGTFAQILAPGIQQIFQQMLSQLQDLTYDDEIFDLCGPSEEEIQAIYLSKIGPILAKEFNIPILDAMELIVDVKYNI